MVSHSRPSPERCAPDPRDALLRDWLPTVLQWCRRLGGPNVDADDAAQEVLLVILRRADGVRDEAALPTWVFAVTRRVLARHRRRAWWRRWWSGPLPEHADPGASAEERLQGRALAEQVGLALDRLGEEHREVLVLVDIEDRSLAEVAELLGVPVGTVKSRLSRARERFAHAARHVGVPEELE